MSSFDPSLKQGTLFPVFGDRFLNDHAGSIISDPQIAVVELVANSWDAGADKVEIKWMENNSDYIEIHDNGTGMLPDEFERIWLELNYNRYDALGYQVIFPENNRTSSRNAFGRNGKGRHGMFCFSDEYFVERKYCAIGGEKAKNCEK